MDTKPFYSSRTFWVSALAAVTPIITHFSPAAGDWLRDNSEWVVTGLGAIGIGLRATTTKSITL